VNRLPLDETTRKALAESRIGQGRFRQDLLSLWNGRCAVTGLRLRELLRAPHIKPWRSSNNAERLDQYNGLLLAPSYDAAFDAGLIAFLDTGKILISSTLDDTAAATLGIASTAPLGTVLDQHKPYLAYHRETVFRA
jgi:putative restriction endonuclease